MSLSRSSKITLNLQYGLAFKRYQSTTESNFNTIPIRLLAIPITSKKSFIYCKHNTLSQLPDKNSLSDKFLEKATTAWHKFENSKSSINIKIVSGLKQLLSKIPWNEGSLKSIPSRDSIIRELKEEMTDKELIISKENKSFIRQSDLIQKDIDSKGKLTQIPIFYPSSITSQNLIKQQLTTYSTDGYNLHRKRLWLCLVGLPFTVPFIILPVVPNIPGFYLCYRAYCHFVAQNGAKHLQYLLNGDHLKYEKLDHHSLQLYKSTEDEGVLKNLESFLEGEKHQDEELILLGEDVIEKICHSFHCDELAGDLKVALKQEQLKLGHN